ncbi:MAG: hypothetical protein IIT58_12655 [Treponema sp.]|nr:hypothetical protein [Treponema sp.]MBQ5472835.1 hypothetical protein [Treponema sp.]
MKKLINVFAILMAIGLCFVSCNHNVGSDSGNSGNSESTGNTGSTGNGGNTGSGGNYLAKYQTAREDYSDGAWERYTIYFYANNTFKVEEFSHWSANYEETEIDARGTYTVISGDWTNGSVSLNATGGEHPSYYNNKTCTISGGALTVPDCGFNDRVFTKQ